MNATIASKAVTEPVRARRDRVDFVDIPRRTYLAVDGCERPGGQTFQNAIATLYPIAYALHFLLRKSGVKASIGALEGRYWITTEDRADANPGGEQRAAAPSRWQLVLPVPDSATEADIEQAIREAARRRTLPAMSRLHVIHWDEHTCAQLLHVGPYASEAPSLTRLRDGITRAGFEPIGPHHEIYLNDPRQVGETRAKTILRLQVRSRTSSPDGSD
ncbi:MAG TPA: GyrI-like domain-containing protein [Candidatus Limnocylindria bacterium]|nr:GyrI-like domain-containing protein [Candidatus Limnocylindria bacterium]